MSYIRRIEPEPERDPIEIVLEELSDIHAILRLLSTRLAALERDRPDNPPQTPPTPPMPRPRLIPPQTERERR